MGLKDSEKMTEWDLMAELKHIKKAAEEEYFRKLEFWSTWENLEFIIWIIFGVEGWEIKSDLTTN